MDKKYQELVEDTSLYPENFVTIYGKNDAHWNTETWKKRERALAHDMVCLLLCNLEANSAAPSKLLNENIRKRKNELALAKLQEMHGDVSMAKRRRLDSGNSDESENEDWACQDDNSGDGDTTANEERMNPNALLYRYIPVEGQENPIGAQNSFSDLWGQQRKTKMFDILDLNDHKLIEVKFSSNYPLHMTKFLADPNTDASNTILIVVNNTTANIEMIYRDLPMPGVSKVTSWVLMRKAIMESKEISDTPFDEVKSVADHVFHNVELNKLLGDFSKFTLYEEPSETKEIKPEDTGVILNTLNSEFLFKNLSQDHLSNNGDFIKWKGKILPSNWKTHIDAHKTDKESIDGFFDFVEDNDIISHEGEEELYRFFLEIQTKWDGDSKEGKNFFLYNCSTARSRKDIPEIIKWGLGIDKKNKKRNDVPGLKQEEYSVLGKKSYDTWFDDLMVGICTPHPFEKEYSFVMEKENKDFIGIYDNMQMSVEYFNKVVALREVGVTMSEIENFNSRLCGSYLAGTNKTGTHCRVVVIPIRSTFYKSQTKEKSRRMSGIVVRGPTHTRSMSDKTNIVIMEIANKNLPIRALGKHCIIRLKHTNDMLVIRQTAYNKIDPPFNAFIRNSLFNPTNLLGDIFNTSFMGCGSIDIGPASHKFLENRETVGFFVERVVEGVMMSLIGNSRDEGYFSMLRKLLMILLNIRRGSDAHSMNPEEFCSSVNECLIDNPLSMWFHNTVLFCCAYNISGGIE